MFPSRQETDSVQPDPVWRYPEVAEVLVRLSGNGQELSGLGVPQLRGEPGERPALGADTQTEGLSDRYAQQVPCPGVPGRGGGVQLVGGGQEGGELDRGVLDGTVVPENMQGYLSLFLRSAAYPWPYSSVV